MRHSHPTSQPARRFYIQARVALHSAALHSASGPDAGPPSDPHALLTPSRFCIQDNKTVYNPMPSYTPAGKNSRATAATPPPPRHHHHPFPSRYTPAGKNYSSISEDMCAAQMALTPGATSTHHPILPPHSSPMSHPAIPFPLCRCSAQMANFSDRYDVFSGKGGASNGASRDRHHPPPNPNPQARAASRGWARRWAAACRTEEDV